MAHQHSFSQVANPLDLLLGEQRMSRRTILRRLVGLTLAGGSVTSFVTSCGYPAKASSAFQTPTPSSLRTVLYTYRGHSGWVNAVAWSPDGKRIASGSQDMTVQVWDAVGGDRVAANGGHVYTYRGHSNPVWTVALSPDGTSIASGSADKTVQ